MMNFAIKTIRLGKYYYNGSNRFEALHDINFEIAAGDSVGIIGRNGAGKSTLLKLISEISKPTGGEILIQGRIASVLDVGVGFHPDLTGRENIFHTGALLGMKKKEITEKLDKIISFSDIGNAIDMPVKKYSSGMYVRLAFSIAIFIDAEILIFDEVLTVGDAAFRLKATDAIREHIRSRKSTVLMVSHNLNEIADLCDKAMWIDLGVLKEYGPSIQIISKYIENILQPRNNTDSIKISDDGNGQIKSVTVSAKGKTPLDTLNTEDEIHIEIIYNKKTEAAETDVGFSITDNLGNKIFLSTSAFKKSVNKIIERGCYKAVSIIPPRLLNAGTFKLAVVLIENKKNITDRMTNAAVFRVELHENDPARLWENYFPGPLKPDLVWEINKISDTV